MADSERPADDPGERLVRPRREMRQTFIEAAEEDARRRFGRSLTDEELTRVLRWYPGDIGERQES
jgi:hypothetical protein